MSALGATSPASAYPGSAAASGSSSTASYAPSGGKVDSSGPPPNACVAWTQTPLGKCVILIITVVSTLLLSGAAGAIIGVTAGGFTGGLIVGGVAASIDVIGTFFQWSAGTSSPQLADVIACTKFLALLFITPWIAGPMFGVFGVIPAISYGKAFLVLLMPTAATIGVVCCCVSCCGGMALLSQRH